MVCSSVNSQLIYQQTIPFLTPIINCDSITIGIYTGLSKSVQPNQNILVAPNPTKGQVSVSAIKEIQNIKLYNAEGKLVQEIKPNRSGATTFNMNHNKGLYFLQLIMKDGSIKTSKIIRE